MHTVKNVNPLFAGAGGTLVANDKPSSTSVVGVTGTGNATDYKGCTRSATYTYMGAYEDTDNLLPVELGSFTANVEHGVVTLHWQTATEVNDNRFDVERSPIVSNKSFVWKKVGDVAGSGSSNSPKDY